MANYHPSFDLGRGLPNYVYGTLNTKQDFNLGQFDMRPLNANQQALRIGIRTLAVRRAEPAGKPIRSSLRNVGWKVTSRG